MDLRTRYLCQGYYFWSCHISLIYRFICHFTIDKCHFWSERQTYVSFYRRFIGNPYTYFILIDSLERISPYRFAIQREFVFPSSLTIFQVSKYVSTKSLTLKLTSQKGNSFRNQWTRWQSWNAWIADKLSFIDWIIWQPSTKYKVNNSKKNLFTAASNSLSIQCLPF